MKLNSVVKKLGSKSFYTTRNGKIFSNLSSSIVFKFINMIISFMMVPITLDYLDKTRYGLWAALSSVLAWFFIFDVGIGSGLRNKYVELKAKGKISEIKQYVSTAYFLFSAIAILIVIVFYVANLFLDWSKILNAPATMKGELSETVTVVFVILCLNFVLKLINTILTADLKNGISNGMTVVAHVITFVGILILSKVTAPSILKYALLYTGANFVVTGAASIYFFLGIYRNIAPSISTINFSLWRDLISVGMKFFFIQIMGIVFFQTTSLLISILIGPDSVADYHITQKYFSLVSMLFVMMVQPLWTGYGDAYYRGEYDWIKKTFKRLTKLWFFVFAALLVMIAIQKPVFAIWLKGRIEVDYIMSVLFVIFYSLQMHTVIYNSFINSTSKLKLSMILGAIIVPLYIPIAIVLIKYLHLGPKGMIISLICVQAIPAVILTPIQSHKILNGAPGIWQK